MNELEEILQKKGTTFWRDFLKWMVRADWTLEKKIKPLYEANKINEYNLKVALRKLMDGQK